MVTDKTHSDESRRGQQKLGVLAAIVEKWWRERNVFESTDGNEAAFERALEGGGFLAESQTVSTEVFTRSK